MKQYRIWAFEHRQWWRPDSEGYTTNSREAGKYTEEQAAHIVMSARGDEVAIVAEPYETGEGPDIIVYDLKTVIAFKP